MRFKMLLLATVSVLLGVTLGSAELPAAATLWPGLESGAFSVGYRVEHLVDGSRSFGSSQREGRPIQISLWYPASDVEGTSVVTWHDYFLSTATETDFSPPDEDRRFRHLEEVRAMAREAGADADRFEKLLMEEVLARLDAPAAVGRFPLVVFVPGFGAPSFQNTVAFEYLASHGFVVASIPSVGSASREMTHDESGVDAQVADISFVLKHVPQIAPADGGRSALVGYSWGGLTASFAAMRGLRVKALVAIDPTLMVKKGHELGRSFEGYDPAGLAIPAMLMIANAMDFKERDVSLFEELSGRDDLLVRFNDLRHGDFGSAIIRFFVHALPGAGGRDVERIDTGYATSCRYLLAFLSAHLNNDVESRAFLSRAPKDNGIPEGVVSVERRSPR